MPKTVILTGGAAEAFPPPKTTAATTWSIWVMKEAPFNKVTSFAPTKETETTFGSLVENIVNLQKKTPCSRTMRTVLPLKYLIRAA